MSKEIDSAKKSISAEINHHQAEISRLESALKILGGDVKDSSTDSKPKATGKKRSKRGKRPDEITEIISNDPGIKAKAIADQLGVKPPGIYVVTKKLIADGRIEKDANGGFNLPQDRPEPEASESEKKQEEPTEEESIAEMVIGDNPIETEAIEKSSSAFGSTGSDRGFGS